MDERPASRPARAHCCCTRTDRVRSFRCYAHGDELEVRPSDNEIRPDSYAFETPSTEHRSPVNKHQGDPAAYSGINAPVPAIGEINVYRAVSGQADTLTCIWRYRYNGETSEQWFTSGEAHNLACKPNGEILCTGDPGLAPSRVAEVRGWNENGIPGGEVKSVYTSSELQILANQLQLTPQEESRADLMINNDFVSTSNLPFDSGSIQTMIDKVPSFIN